MQDVDIRYAFILFPLIYVILPYFLTGSFIILGGVSLFALITGIIILIIISNLNFGGQENAGALTANEGIGLNIGLSSEGGYSLFVVVIGALFYLGAQVAIFVTPILDMIVGVINSIIGFIGWVFGFSITSLQTSLVYNMGSVASPNLNKVYPLSITIQNISVFGALDVVMAIIFVLGLYFMVSSRGH